MRHHEIHRFTHRFAAAIRSLRTSTDQPRPVRIASLATALLVLVTMPGAGALSSAFANDLSTYPCTAGDVEIIGSGVIINEPCECPPGGTFTARVQFTVRNNTSTGRYCIALHLVPDGTVATTPIDVILRAPDGTSTAPGKSGGERHHDTVMFGEIPNFPCNVGRVCFGQAGVVRGKCLPGACTTISWNTSPGNAACAAADENPPGGQCRHQQICVVGFGASLSCTDGCTPACGSSTTLQACTTASPDRAPFTFRVDGSDGSTATISNVGAESSGTSCRTFTVTPTGTPNTTYTLTVTDKFGCTRTATSTIPVTAVTASITAPSAPGCSGVLDYTASASGSSGCTFAWTIDGLSPAAFVAAGTAADARMATVSGTGNVNLAFRSLDNVCHTLAVTATCTAGGGTCSATASKTVKQCVTSTLSCTP
jgi:hypothetical protein